MQLWLVVTTPTDPDGTECVVDVAPHHTVADLSRALAEQAGLDAEGLRCHLPRSGGVIPAELSVEASDLRFGDTVLLAPAGWQASALPEGVTGELVVVGGPAAGRRHPLPAAPQTVGRSTPAGIAIDDPMLSRKHFSVAIDGSQVVVTDLGSTNGTYLDGVQIQGSRTVAAGTVIEAGHSLFRVDPAQAAVSPSLRLQHGIVGFNRPPRVTAAWEPPVHHAPKPPQKPERRRLGVASWLIPLLLGAVVLALGVSEQSTTMMAIGGLGLLMSPVMMIAGHIEETRGGSRRYRTELAAYRAELAELATALDAGLEAEVVRRRLEGPSAADLAARAQELSADLWERRPGDGDFLQVSVGWADQPTMMTVVLPAEGDADLLAEAETLAEQHQTAVNVPILLNLREIGGVGLCGDRTAVVRSATWMTVQLATTHSPREVALAAAVTEPERADWAWMEWLPHVQVPPVGLGDHPIAFGEVAAAVLFDQLTKLIRARSEVQLQLGAANREGPAATVVVLVSERLELPRSVVTPLLEDGPRAGVHVIWLGEDRTTVPGAVGALVDCTSSPSRCMVIFPRGNRSIGPGVLDQLDRAVGTQVGRALAAVRDITAGGAGAQIPATVPILDLLGLAELSDELVVRRWLATPFGLDAPVGRSATGPFVIDLRRDGPHALVGGTTGAGKSELLQSWVITLAANHPPNRVTFLLVDYKGGAAFKDVVHLPHTVGFVTDLDGHLVRRALVSLEAELRYREHLLRDYGAKDLLEMESRYPEAAPPALLLVVDEFAALAKELPQFVDGVVNIAQRGRSLGIHLVLATQRPAGAINDNVRANTNLRIALRMNDAADSSDVIDARDAALLPRSLPGRGYVRTGQSELTEIQVAYAGARRVAAARTEGSVRVRVRDAEPEAAPSGPSEATDAPSDLQRLVETISLASGRQAIPPQRTPWLEVLPTLLGLDALTTAEPRRGEAVLGLADLPETQAQRPVGFDFERDGHLLVHGTSGSGKTTLLRTLAVSAARGHSPRDLVIYAMDFASRGLGSLESLPQVGSVIPGADTERVRRLILTLQGWLDRRRGLFEAAGVSLLSEYLAVAAEPLPRVLVMLDGYAGFTTVFDRIDYGEWIERLSTLVADGRPLGIHFAITSDRRGTVPSVVSNACGLRVVLRMGDEDEYLSLGVESAAVRGAVLPPGRGFAGAGTDLQIAIVGEAADGGSQTQAVLVEGERLSTLHRERAPRVGSLATQYSVGDLPTDATVLTAWMGLGQSELRPVSLDLREGTALIAGPGRSGKSTALTTLIAGLRQSTPDARFVLFAPRRTPLTSLELWERKATGLADCDELAAELHESLAERTDADPVVIVVIDDATELTDSTAEEQLEVVARRGRDAGVFVVAAAESTLARRAYAGPVAEGRRSRNGIVLRPDADLDGELIGVNVPRAQPTFWVPGRGVIGAGGIGEVVQVAIGD